MFLSVIEILSIGQSGAAFVMILSKSDFLSITPFRSCSEKPFSEFPSPNSLLFLSKDNNASSLEEFLKSHSNTD